MRVTFWGCRGSIPVSGAANARYGGNTTCLEVRLEDGSLIVLDAGTGIRNLGKKMIQSPNGRDIYLIFTHPHWDHLMGFPHFAPAYSDHYRIHIRGGPIAKQTIRDYLEHQMQPPYFPARFCSMKAEFDFTHGIPLVKHIGGAEVAPIPLSHPNGGYGYRITENGSSLVFLTDNEPEYDHEGSRAWFEYVNFCRDADLLVHDAQYTRTEYERAGSWGHSTYETAVALASQANVKRLALFHHDPDHDDATLDRIAEAGRLLIAQRKRSIACFAAAEGTSLVI
jgi:phosphoribosyl 1,2-cyclic phosphodiesterase